MQNNKVKLKFIDEHAKVLYLAKSSVNQEKSAIVQEEMNAGLQLYATKVSIDTELQIVTYHTGVCVEIPNNCVGDIRPRSSIYKYPLILANGVGTVETTYRGELLVKFRYNLQLAVSSVNKYQNIDDCHKNEENFILSRSYQIGENIGQLVLLYKHEVSEYTIVEALSETSRGEGGFGSTGK